MVISSVPIQDSSREWFPEVCFLGAGVQEMRWHVFLGTRRLRAWYLRAMQ
jgi:hypothetical protein